MTSQTPRDAGGAALVRAGGSRTPRGASPGGRLPDTQGRGLGTFQFESRSEIRGRLVSQLEDRQSALSLSRQYLFSLMTRGRGHVKWTSTDSYCLFFNSMIPAAELGPACAVSYWARCFLPWKLWARKSFVPAHFCGRHSGRRTDVLCDHGSEVPWTREKRQLWYKISEKT